MPIVLSTYFLPCPHCGQNGWIISPYGEKHAIYSRRHGYRTLTSLQEKGAVTDEEYCIVKEQITASNLPQEHEGTKPQILLENVITPENATVNGTCSIH